MPRRLHPLHNVVHHPRERFDSEAGVAAGLGPLAAGASFPAQSPLELVREVARQQAVRYLSLSDGCENLQTGQPQGFGYLPGEEVQELRQLQLPGEGLAYLPYARQAYHLHFPRFGEPLAITLLPLFSQADEIVAPVNDAARHQEEEESHEREEISALGAFWRRDDLLVALQAQE